MRDATDYHYAAGTRRLGVRQAHPDGETADLRPSAEAYADDLKSYLGATQVRVGDPQVTAGGGLAIIVRASLPDASLVAAILRLGDGPLTELTLLSRHDDDATAEFERLLASARPSTGTAMEVIARNLAGSGTGTTVGPLVLDLGEAYRPVHDFVLESTDGQERYRVAMTLAAMEGVSKSTATGASLLASGHGMMQAVGEDDRPVRFEMMPPPASYSRGARVVAAPDAEASAALPTARGVPAPAVSGTVQGRAVRVQPVGPGATPGTAAQLVDTLNTVK